MFAARAHHLDARHPAGARRGAVGGLRSVHRCNDGPIRAAGAARTPQLIATLREAVQQGLEPDLTLLLDAPLEVGSASGSRRGVADHFEREQQPLLRARSRRLSERSPRGTRSASRSSTRGGRCRKSQQEIEAHARDAARGDRGR